MARKFASINMTIWQDDDFRALSPAAQHLYFVLLADPKLTYCGTGDWRPKHVAQKAAGWSLSAVEAAAYELAEARLVLWCDDTDEFLIRSFVRHDGVMSHPKLCVSAAVATTEVGSNALRKVVIGELKRLKDDRPNLGAWERKEVIDAVKRESLNGKEVDPFREPFSPGLREAVREALSLNAPSALERPYERPYNSNGNTTTLQHQHSGEELRTEVTSGESNAGDTSPEIQPCGRKHDASRPCGGCKRANEIQAEAERREKSQAASSAARQKAARDQEAIDACDMCGDNGRLDNGRTCHHVESVGMPESMKKELEQLRGGSK